MSLDHTRKPLADGQLPQLEWYKDLLSVEGGAADADYVAMYEQNTEGVFENNLCFMLAAAVIINAANDASGLPRWDLRWQHLQELANKIGVPPKQQWDVTEAICRLQEVAYVPVRVVTMTEFEEETPNAMVILRCEATDPTPDGWKEVIGATFQGATVLSAVGVSAYSGHYVVVPPGRQSVVRLIKPSAVRKALPTVRGVEPQLPHRALRHAMVRHIIRNARQGQGVIFHWINGREAGCYWATIKSELDQSGIALVQVEKKRCTCDQWRCVEPFEVHLPSSSATYVRVELKESDELRKCACNADDDEEEQTGPATNDNVQGWTNQEELRSLRASVSATRGGFTAERVRRWYIHQKRPKHVHVLVWRACAAATRKAHVEMLELVKTMPSDCLKMPFPTACVEMLMRMAQERKWAWSTIASKLSMLATALKNLPLYTSEPEGVDIRESPIYQAALQRSQKLARVAGPEEQLSKPMTVEAYERLCQHASTLSTRTLLQVSWWFAARIGDLRCVKAADVSVQKKASEPTHITFKGGKGGAFWGPFTIASVLPANVAKDLTELIRRGRNAPTIWSRTDQAHLATLVATDGLNLRSIRRGALLHYASKGVSDDHLQLLSGHKRKDTLLRYLGWGRHSSTADEAAQVRAEQVMGGDCQEPRRMGHWSGKEGQKGQRVAKPPPFLWQRPPTRQQLGLTRRNRDEEFPLHIKDVPTVNWEAIQAMATTTPYRQDIGELRRWCEGAALEQVPAMDLNIAKMPRSRFTPEQIAQMAKAGKLEPVKEEEIRGWVTLFGIADDVKKRIRIIAEPFLNRLINEDSYPRLGYPSRLERRVAMQGMKYVAEFDFAAYFDQFELAEKARNWFAVRTQTTNGCSLWRLTRLPMGAKFSPAIAQYVTWALCWPCTELPGVVVHTMIDNVRIAATTEASFVKAVKLFLGRVKRANLKLNEEALPYIEGPNKRIAELGARNFRGPFTFLGEEYRAYQVANTAKLVDKLRIARGNVKEGTTTYREMASLIGLALYMTNTIGVDLAAHGGLIKAYASLFGDGKWDEKLPFISMSLLSKIDALVKELLENKPVTPGPLRAPSMKNEDYDAVILFDACKSAWAAHVYRNRQAWRVVRGYTTPVKHSAHAETVAAKEIVTWARSKFGKDARIALVTDHEALAKGQRRWWSGHGGFSTAYHLNEAFKEINKNIRAEIWHVEGLKNPTDGDSRSDVAAKTKGINVTEMEVQRIPQLSEFYHPYARRPTVIGF